MSTGLVFLYRPLGDRAPSSIVGSRAVEDANFGSQPGSPLPSSGQVSTGLSVHAVCRMSALTKSAMNG
jgi:hypothetical protein